RRLSGIPDASTVPRTMSIRRPPALPAIAVVLVVAHTAATGCGRPAPERWTDDGPVADGHSCNPIASEWDCLLPYPSDFYLAPDPSLPSGSRVEIPRPALPLLVDEADLDARIDFFQEQPADGFSVGAQIGVQIPGGVDVTGLPFYTTD